MGSASLAPVSVAALDDDDDDTFVKKRQGEVFPLCPTLTDRLAADLPKIVRLKVQREDDPSVEKTFRVKSKNTLSGVIER